jgi:hypothetical protein
MNFNQPRDALGRFRRQGRAAAAGQKAPRGLGKNRVGGKQTNSKSSGGTLAGVPAAKANRKPKDPGEGSKS